jgi:hypothetical protein
MAEDATSRRTAWHVLFARLVGERAPHSIEVRAEVPLGTEPPRADLLLLRRRAGPSADAAANVLRGLWPRIECVALLEFKSVSRPIRRGGLAKLVACCGLYYQSNFDDLRRPSALTLVLVVASKTPTLAEELASFSCSLRSLGGGYAAIDGLLFPSLLIVLDDVARAEHDELVGAFGNGHLGDAEARSWWQHHTGETMMTLKELQDFEEVERKYIEGLPLEKRLAGLAPEQVLASYGPEARLAGLPPEERLAGLAPEEAWLAMPPEVLREIPDEAFEKLPPAVRDVLRLRKAGR